MKRIALVLALAACGRDGLDGDNVPVTKQPVAWPLLGGLQGKAAPLVLVPGSYLQLDDVWMQRANEWRARAGHDSLTAPTAPVLTAGETANGGLIAALDTGRWSTYDPAITSQPWVFLPKYDPVGTPTTGLVTDHANITAHTRVPAISFPPATSPARSGSMAYGGGFYMIAVELATTVGIYVYDAGTNQLVAMAMAFDLGITGAVRPRCAYVGNRLVCFVIDSGSSMRPIIIRTDVANPTFSLGTAAAAAAWGTPADAYLDAMYYTGSTITVVYRNAAGTIAFDEYNPATNAYTTAATIAVNCGNALHLGQEPDASGVRLIGYSSTAPATRVIRATSAGAVTTDDLVEAIASTQIAPVAFTAGADWQVYYQTAGPIVKRARKLTGVVSARGTIPGVWLDSGAWRVPAVDQSRVVLGVSDADLQSDYFEYADDFSTGSTTYRRFEPQARLLPLEAGPPPIPNSAIPHVLPDGAGNFRTTLSRISFVERQGGAGITNAIAFDQWVLSYPTKDTIPSVNIGRPLKIGARTFIPSGSLMQLDPGVGLVAHGLSTEPPQPALAPSAVGGSRLTLLATYQYALVAVGIDENGDRWRSPVGVPKTITLTGGQDTVTVTFTPHLLEADARLVQFELYRTSGNGSLLRKLAIFSDRVYNLRLLATPFTYVDSVADTLIASAEDIYTTGEVPNILTPPLSHVESWNQRLWGVDRDRRSIVVYTKRLRTGRSPEFAEGFELDLTDDKGDITGLAALDDKLVVFKKNARYFIQGDGLEDSGAGQVPSVTRIDSDVGAIAGSPVVSTGDEAYFVSERGIYRTNSSGSEDFVGAPVDQFLNQPQVNTPLTIRAALFNSDKNEVRFMADAGAVNGAHYLLVYSREFGYWCRWRFDPLLQGLTMVNRSGTPTVFQYNVNTTTPAVIAENDATANDAGIVFSPFIRSPWVRGNGEEGRLRVYEGRVLGQRTGGSAGVTPIFSVYYDFDDTTVVNYSPSVQIAPDQIIRAGARFRRTRCTAFSFALSLPANDLTTRLEQWSAVVGLEAGPDAARKSTRW